MPSSHNRYSPPQISQPPPLLLLPGQQRNRTRSSDTASNGTVSSGTTTSWNGKRHSQWLCLPNTRTTLILPWLHPFCLQSFNDSLQQNYIFPVKINLAFPPLNNGKYVIGYVHFHFDDVIEGNSLMGISRKPFKVVGKDKISNFEVI